MEVDSEDEAIAEVNFVLNEDGYGKREGTIRYIAVLRAVPGALGMNDDEPPHHTDKPANAIRVSSGTDSNISGATDSTHIRWSPPTRARRSG